MLASRGKGCVFSLEQEPREEDFLKKPFRVHGGEFSRIRWFRLRGSGIFSGEKTLNDLLETVRRGGIAGGKERGVAMRK